jgi:hypothetical protein
MFGKGLEKQPSSNKIVTEDGNVSKVSTRKLLAKKFELSLLPLVLDLIDTLLSFIAIVMYVAASYGIFDDRPAADVVAYTEVRALSARVGAAEVLRVLLASASLSPVGCIP